MKITSAEVKTRTNESGNTYYYLIGDTDRFGEQEVLFESPKMWEVSAYCEEHEVEYKQVYEMEACSGNTNKEIRKNFEYILSEEEPEDYKVKIYIMEVDEEGRLIISLDLLENGKVMDCTYTDKDGSMINFEVAAVDSVKEGCIPMCYAPTKELQKKAEYEYKYFKKYFKNVELKREAEVF